jgi:uncharacterized lipoprotein YmbA
MRRTRSGLLAAATALALAACAAPVTRYYSLAGAPPVPLAGMAGAVTSPAADTPPVQLELVPVGVPERLARPQMVVRSADPGPSTRVEVLEQQRWSSSFDSELRDAFATTIASRLAAVDVTRGGRLPQQRVYRVAVRLRYYEAVLDKQVDADFGWTITRSDDSRNAVCRLFVSEPAGPGIDGLVQGLQQAVAAAADRIAAQIALLQAAGTAGCEATATTRAAPHGL